MASHTPPYQSQMAILTRTEVKPQVNLKPVPPPGSRLRSLLSTLPKLVVDLSEEKTFLYFNKLPVELRVKIWRFASRNNPRSIGLRRLTRMSYAQPNDPGILSACKESRHEGLAYYTACRERVHTSRTRVDTDGTHTIEAYRTL